MYQLISSDGIQDKFLSALPLLEQELLKQKQEYNTLKQQRLTEDPIKWDRHYKLIEGGLKFLTNQTEEEIKYAISKNWNDIIYAETKTDDIIYEALKHVEREYMNMVFNMIKPPTEQLCLNYCINCNCDFNEALRIIPDNYFSSEEFCLKVFPIWIRLFCSHFFYHKNTPMKQTKLFLKFKTLSNDLQSKILNETIDDYWRCGGKEILYYFPNDYDLFKKFMKKFPKDCYEIYKTDDFDNKEVVDKILKDKNTTFPELIEKVEEKMVRARDGGYASDYDIENISDSEEDNE